MLFLFGKINLFFLVLCLCNWVFRVKKLLKVSGRLFFSWSWANGQLAYITMYYGLSILDSLYKLSTNSHEPVKFNIHNALFRVLSFVSTILLCFCPHIWHPYLRFSRWYLNVRCSSSISPRYYVLQIIFIFCPLTLKFKFLVYNCFVFRSKNNKFCFAWI